MIVPLIDVEGRYVPSCGLLHSARREEDHNIAAPIAHIVSCLPI